MDRYSYSGAAYTFAKDKGISLEWCMIQEHGLPKPDIIFFLDINPKILQNRGDYGKERYENLQMQTKTYQAFQKIIHNNHHKSNWKVMSFRKMKKKSKFCL